MGLHVGIVGLPNVGKSTIFNALTGQQRAEAANYPFCTIEANKATVAIKDPRVDAISELVSPASEVRATVDFVDIAGLVRGANTGEGLGNQFLATIREADAVMHVVRCFEDDDVAHVEGGVDPCRDAEIVETELVLSDLQRLESRVERLEKQARSDPGAREMRDAAVGLLEHLGNGNPVRSYDSPGRARLDALRREMQFLTDKPMIYCANVDETGMSEDNAHVVALRAYAADQGAELVKISARIEEELCGMDDEDRIAFLSSYGIDHGGLQQVVHAGFGALGLISFFTAGPKEVRAWTVREGTRAPQAAGTIHSDFERGFIRAQVIAYADYIARGGEQACKAAGVMRQEGKEYVVEDGDVILFLFNV